MSISPPGNSPEISRIWETLGFWERLYCKYCFLQNTSVSAIWVGVFSAYLVNIFTNMIGMTFLGSLHVIAYVANIIFSVGIFACVVRLYSIHVDSKEKNNSESGTKNEHMTLELKYFEDNLFKIKSVLHHLLIWIVLLLVTIVICSVINNLNLPVSPASSETRNSAVEEVK